MEMMHHIHNNMDNVEQWEIIFISHQTTSMVPTSLKIMDQKVGTFCNRWNCVLLVSLNLNVVYTGKAMVHEWAHLRWGVYDGREGEPYYYDSNEILQATRHA